MTPVNELISDLRIEGLLKLEQDIDEPRLLAAVDVPELSRAIRKRIKTDMLARKNYGSKLPFSLVHARAGHMEETGSPFFPFAASHFNGNRHGSNPVSLKEIKQRAEQSGFT